MPSKTCMALVHKTQPSGSPTSTGQCNLPSPAQERQARRSSLAYHLLTPNPLVRVWCPATATVASQVADTATDRACVLHDKRTRQRAPKAKSKTSGHLLTNPAVNAQLL